MPSTLKGSHSSGSVAIYAATLAIAVGLSVVLLLSTDDRNASMDSPRAAGLRADSEVPTSDASSSSRDRDRPAVNASDTLRSPGLPAALENSARLANIPIPDRLSPLFDPSSERASDRIAIHEQLEREPREAAWAAFNETRITSFLASQAMLENYEVLSLQCRRLTCEALMIGHGEVIENGQNNTAVRTLFEALVPSMGNQYWFNFSGLNIGFELLDGAAVGFQLILQRGDPDIVPAESQGEQE